MKRVVMTLLVRLNRCRQLLRRYSASSMSFFWFAGDTSVHPVILKQLGDMKLGVL